MDINAAHLDLLIAKLKYKAYSLEFAWKKWIRE